MIPNKKFIKDKGLKIVLGCKLIIRIINTMSKKRLMKVLTN